MSPAAAGPLLWARGARRLRAKLQRWAKAALYEAVLQKAHAEGIRVYRVLARGTSMYAFDGSGEIAARSNGGKIALFQSGKRYDADLNAAYNIAARYFIKQILKALPETTRSQAEANVPSLAERTAHTLSSLVRLREVVGMPRRALASRRQEREAPSIADGMGG